MEGNLQLKTRRIKRDEGEAVETGGTPEQSGNTFPFPSFLISNF
jgi:hypothetical protein